MPIINFDSVQQGMFFDYCCPQCNKEMSGAIDNDLNGDFLGIQQCEHCRVVWVWILSEDKFNCTVKGF